MSLGDKELLTIKSILQKYLDPDKDNVFLFGSYAKGLEHDKSDIDIAIKSSAPLDLTKWALLEEEFEQSELSQKVDLVDYLRVTDDFQKVIDKEGIKISIN